VFGKLAAITVALTVLAVPTAQAATTDTATAVASPGPYLVDVPITFTSTTPCTTACRLIWKYLSGTRLGVQLGEGVSVARAFSTPGLKTVELRLTELCVGTSRLVCASPAYVSVFVEGLPPVVDTTAPTLTASGLDVEATGPTTVVNYTFDATDPDDAVVSQLCSPEPGSAFPVGSTPIDCTAVDSNGNVGTAGFTVVVSDTTAPALSVPGPITVEATSSAGAAVDFAASATDLVDGAVTPDCSMPSGATFPLGSTTVNCTATDAHGNSSGASFDVVVVDRTAPGLSVPGPITVEATSSAGAAVDFAVSATDLVDGAVVPSCSKASGSTFPLGSTTVDCTATDAHGNRSSASFVINVVDLTAPTLSAPGPIVVNATSSAGAIVAYTVTATDSVGGPVAPVCSKPSGSVFPIGTTTVTCRATDSRGNTSSASTFDVHVKGAAEQLADVLHQVQRLGLRHGVADRVRAVMRSVSTRQAGSEQACGLFGDLDKRLGEPQGKRLTTVQRGILRGELARIENVVGCTLAERRGKKK
jgi:HYR domain